MLRRRLVLVLAVAMAMGLLTGYVVYRAVKTARSPQSEAEEIVVAAANIALGEAMTPKHLKVTPWPKAAAPAGFLRSIKEAEGRVARVSMVVGEPVLDAKLAPVGQGGLMPVLIPSGKRAVTIKVDEAVQKTGFILPNSRVDVLVTMARRSGESKETRTVLQDVAVLAADQTTEMKDNKPVTMTTVTMAISPREAERLALAQNEGRVTLALRNHQDSEQVSTPGVTADQLLGAPPLPPGRGRASASSARTSVERASNSARPPQASPPPQGLPAPPSPPPQVRRVSVVRGVTVTNLTFSPDPDGGWKESPGKSDAGKQPQ